MKKLILILILATTVIMGGFDKEEFDESRFHSGLKLGLTYSNVSSDEDKDLNGAFGFELGAFVLKPINNRLSFQPEFLITQKGYSRTTDTFVDFETSYNLTYLQVPVLLTLKTALNVKVYGGGYLSYFINASLNSDEASSTADEEKAVENSIKDFDAGVVLGVMFRGSYNLLFDLRFERGLTSYKKDTNIKEFNQSFKLSVGWLF